MAAVTVLTPNGRRQTVKVCPNTPLLQVLEEVCKKYGFNPDDHGLKFQRTVVDLTLPWRFANLPNNAKLEMVPSRRKAAAADSQVRIALQMEDGSRLQGCFSCEHSLWELLAHFPDIGAPALSDPESTPVCVYMRDEVSGEEALKKSTLRSLGLTGGSAIIRFLLRKSQTCGEEATDMPSTSTLAVAEESTRSASSPLHPSQTQTPTPEVPEETHTSPSSASATNTLPVQEVAIPSTDDVDHLKTPPTGREMPEEKDEEAGPPGLDSPSCSYSSAPSAPVVPFSGGSQRLGGPGGGSVRGSSSSASSSAVTATGESPKAKKAKSSPGSKSRCQRADSQQQEDMDQADECFQREPVIYHLDSAARHPEDHSEVPDEFFEVTVDDIRKRFAQLKSERKLLEEAPLMTKALREAQMKEKIDRYPKVVLRVQFPDRHVLQGFFRPLETVAALRHFVKSHLADPQLRFYLFVTPPKTILDDPSATLFQADLFPGALVYFGSNPKPDFYLKKELMQTSVTASKANESIASCMLRVPGPSSNNLDSQSPPPPPPETTVDTRETTQEASDLTAETAAKPPRTDPGKVPKWLKLPGKK